MKPSLNVKANLCEPEILKTVVEELASRHVDMRNTNIAIPQQWKVINSSCIQASVSGTLDMYTNNHPGDDQESTPFDSYFLFTCIKEISGFFKLEWSVSLS